MTTSFISGKFRETDANGAPLAGGLLYTYAAGTLTPQQTFTNFGMGSPNTNPVILDASGRADVWLSAQAYRMILKTAAGVTVWDVDNIQDPTALLTSFEAALAAPGGAGFVGTAYGTLATDLANPRPVARGGTGAATSGQALTNLGLIDIASTTTVNGTTALTSSHLGRCILLVDGGAPANYTVTLPTGSPVNSIIMIRVSSAATKLYTLAGSDVGVDGQANRILWAGESCLLVRESGQWTKIGGRSIPFAGLIQATGTQSISTGSTFQKATLAQGAADLSGLNLCFDAGNNRFVAPRRNNFAIDACLSVAATCSVAGTVSMDLDRNGASAPTQAPACLVEQPYLVGQGRAAMNTSGVFSCSAGDYIELIGRVFGGTFASQAFEYQAGTVVSTLGYVELLSW